MARNQLEKYLNQLDIRRADYLEKQLKEYKFQRFKKSLEMLQKASYYHTIPNDIINEIETIFKLMPVHELYFIKINENEFKEYIERLNRLYITVLDDYESFDEVVTPKYWGNSVFILYFIGLFHKKIESWFGPYIVPAAFGCFFVFALYQNRIRFRRYFDKFLKL